MHYGVMLATPPYFRSSTINVARCIICIHPTTIISWILKSHQMIPDLCYNKYSKIYWYQIPVISTELTPVYRMYNSIEITSYIPQLYKFPVGWIPWIPSFLRPIFAIKTPHYIAKKYISYGHLLVITGDKLMGLYIL